MSEVTTLAATDFQSMRQSHGDSAFLRAVARFEGELVLEIDHTRVIDERLNVAPPPAARPAGRGEPLDDAAPAGGAPSDGEAGLGAGDAPLDVELLETSYAFLARPADRLALRTYARLFEASPELRAAFATDMHGQQRALSAALSTIVGHVRSPEMLAAYAGGLGERDALYGAPLEHFDAFASAALGAMAEIAGQRWTGALELAWRRCLEQVHRLMTEGAAEGRLKAA